MEVAYLDCFYASWSGQLAVIGGKIIPQIIMVFYRIVRVIVRNSDVLFANEPTLKS